MSTETRPLSLDTTADTSLVVTVHLMFAFDLGYEIDLESARKDLHATIGPLARRPRRTPESIRYRPAPLRLPVEITGVMLPTEGTPLRAPLAELAVFDFGAVSLCLSAPLRAVRSELPRLAAALGESEPLTADVREALKPWIERLRPYTQGFKPSVLTEEYVVFQVHSPRRDWLNEDPSWIAGLLRLDADPLSKPEVSEATRYSLSYTPDDLVVLDWAAGFVADVDCQETLQVIEFANVQLLEFREIDDHLDDRLEAAWRLVRPETANRWRQRALTMLGFGSHVAALRHVRELEIEATSLFERADNALKLIGDQYLSRVYSMTSRRFHLDEWQQSIQRKLDAVGDVYDLLVSQSGERRSTFLEIVIIVLIAFEIVLTLSGL